MRCPETESTKGDEFCPPSIVVDSKGQPLAPIGDNDSVLFFNFRGDRPRELTRAFIEDSFDGFDRVLKRHLLPNHDQNIKKVFAQMLSF